MNAKPFEYAPKIRFINVNKNPLPRRRYVKTTSYTVPIEVLYQDITDKQVEIVPNQPIKMKDKIIPPLEAHFFKYASRLQTIKKKSIKYNLV